MKDDEPLRGEDFHPIYVNPLFLGVQDCSLLLYTDDRGHWAYGGAALSKLFLFPEGSFVECRDYIDKEVDELLERFPGLTREPRP